MDRQFGQNNTSNNIQKKSRIGLWTVEIDEGCDPRMFADEIMLELLGLTECLEPEEIFRIWMDNIEPGYIAVVHEFVSRMIDGEHTEVRYPWNTPSGERRLVRCCGIRDYDYTKGIRLEGSHQDVTGVVQLMEESYNMVLEAVSDNYYLILHVNFETGDQIIYKCLDRYYNHISEFEGMGYYERNKAYCDKYVILEDRKNFMEMIDVDHILSHLEAGEDVIINYRAILDGEVEWFRTRIFKHQLHKGKKCAILTVRNVTEDHQEEMQQMAENAVISGLSMDYNFVVYYNFLNHLYTVFKSDPDGIFPRMPGGTFREKLESFAEIYIPSNDRKLFLESTKEDFIYRNISDGKIYFFNFRSVDKGTIFHDQIKYVPNIIDGSIVGVIAGYHNIDLEYNQRMESEEEHTTLATLANSFVAVYFVDLSRDYCKIYYNKDSFFGGTGKIYSYQEFMKEYLENCVSDEDRLRCKFLTSSEYIRGQLKEKEYIKISYTDISDGKRNYTLELFKTNPDGSCFVLCRNDVTEVLKQEVEHQNVLKEALNMAQTANHAKTAFLSNMSHDIRTPMNAIIGFTGLAQNHIDNREQVSTYLTKIKNSSNHLLSLINDVLDMSRIESGKLVLTEEKENLNDILRQICDMTAPEIARKKMNFVLNVKKNINENIICDRLRLNQILINLVSNAIKYTPDQGTVSLALDFREAHEKGCSVYYFTVKDNGMGMSEKFLETIYEPFTRAKSSTMSGIQGTGLGLAITKSLVDIMTGTIKIESELGVGTEVNVIFKFRNWTPGEQQNTGDTAESPMAAPDESTVSDSSVGSASEASLNNSEAASAVSETSCDTAEKDEDTERDSSELTKNSASDNSDKYDFAGKRILVVEDNELNMEIAQEILQDAGLEVDVVTDGIYAVESMKEQGRYDAVLMDVQMPIMDGYEATRQIRKMDNEYTRNIPIIAMTANAFDADKKNALESGMNAHVSKPINVDLLLKVLADYFR